MARNGVSDASACGLPIDEHGAGAANTLLAAQMGAGEIQLVAQEVGEMGPRLDQFGGRPAIHAKLERDHDQLERPMAASRAFGVAAQIAARIFSGVSGTSCTSARKGRSASF